MEETSKNNRAPTGYVVALPDQSSGATLSALGPIEALATVKTLTMLSQWPEHFPPSCPPVEAKPDAFQAFRLVSSIPPTKEDFFSHFIANLPFNPDELCRACGLSVYRELEAAKAARKRYKPLRSKMVAVGFIGLNDGVVMQTSSPGHHTWWAKTTAPEASFNEVHPE